MQEESALTSYSNFEGHNNNGCTCVLPGQRRALDHARLRQADGAGPQFSSSSAAAAALAVLPGENRLHEGLESVELHLHPLPGRGRGGVVAAVRGPLPQPAHHLLVLFLQVDDDRVEHALVLAHHNLQRWTDAFTKGVQVE